MRRLDSSLVFGLLVTILAQAAASATVKLRAAPQKFREFYAIDDARIPINIRNQLAKPARTARRGRAQWTAETDALVRKSGALGAGAFESLATWDRIGRFPAGDGFPNSVIPTSGSCPHSNERGNCRCSG